METQLPFSGVLPFVLIIGFILVLSFDIFMRIKGRYEKE